MTSSTSVRRGRLSKSQRTKESILVVAEELFSENGFDATSLDAIGRRAGIQGTAILYHYATKRELYEAVLNRIFSPYVEELYTQFDDDGPLDDRLVAITSAMVRFAARRPAAARLILRETTAGSADAKDIMGHATARHWKRLLDVLTAERDDDMDVDPLVVWNIIVGAVCFYFSAGPTVGGLVDDPTDPERVRVFENVMMNLTRSLCTGHALSVTK